MFMFLPTICCSLADWNILRYTWNKFEVTTVFHLVLDVLLFCKLYEENDVIITVKQVLSVNMWKQ